MGRAGAEMTLHTQRPHRARLFFKGGLLDHLQEGSTNPSPYNYARPSRGENLLR